MSGERTTGVMHPDRAARAPPDTSGNEQELARAAARLEVLVGAARLFERVAAPDAHVELAAGDPAEHGVRALEQLLAAGDVVGEPGAGDELPARLQALGIERGRRPGRHAVEDHVAARPEGFDPVLERRRPDA